MRLRGRVRMAWILLAVWAAWGFALQGELARSGILGAQVPELGLVLLLALSGRAPRGRVLLAASLLALARAASSGDPLLVCFSAYLAAAGTLLLLRDVLDVERPLLRLLIGGALAVGLCSWLALCHSLRMFERPDLLPLVPLSVLGAGLPTALCTLFPAPVLLRVLGLSALAEAH